jgi:hypothetical protein
VSQWLCLAQKLIYVSLPSDDDSIYSSLDSILKSTTLTIPPLIAAPNPVPVGMTQSPMSISSTPAPVTAVNVDVSETLVPTATVASQPFGQIQNVPVESMRPFKKVKTAVAVVVGTGFTSKYGSMCDARQS